jgi:RNA polymerase-binding transcription factor DksA
MRKDNNLAVIKEHLQAELDSLQEQHRTIETQLENRPQFGLGQGDPGAATWEMNLARRQRLETRTKELRAALSRLDQGTYGVCDRCGKRISPERLEIVPTTALCAECAGAEVQEAA